MKTCEYCGSLVPDKASICASCGGNSFQNQCVNCGFSFKGGVVCPRCGVRVDQEAKHCPRCKATYYTPACPSCGYSPEQDTAASPAPEQQKKRHTALWVLGWIFVPYIAGTVLVVRSKKLPVWAKAIILLLIWGLVFYIGISEDSSQEESTVPETQVETAAQEIEDSFTETYVSTIE